MLGRGLVVRRRPDGVPVGVLDRKDHAALLERSAVGQGAIGGDEVRWVNFERADAQ